MILWAVLAYGRGGGGIPVPVIVVVAIVVILLISQRKKVAKVIAPGRHTWTPEENRAVIKFYQAHKKLDPQQYEEELLKFAKELGVTPNSARMAAKSAAGLVDPKPGKALRVSKGLREEWEKYKGK